MRPHLCATGLDVGFRRHVVVRDVTLGVGPGEIVGLGGPSGSGKSTLLRVLAGLIPPVAGSVVVRTDDDEVPVTRFARSRAGAIGIVSQDPLGSLDPLWHVRRIVGEPAWHLPRDRRDAAVAAALGRVGLGGIDRRARPAELSLGQCQRVAIARITVGRPAIVLADEPTSALDASSAVAVTGLLTDLAADGAGLLIASHDEPLLARLCRRVLRIVDGRLEASS